MKAFCYKIFLAGLGILLNGCTHPFYAPNRAHIPILKEKNYLRLSLAYIETTDGWTSGKGSEIQGAYAAGSNLGILFNAFTAESLLSHLGTGHEFGGRI